MKTINAEIYDILSLNFKYNWDIVEIHPVIEDSNGNCTRCNEGEESYWSVYINTKTAGSICIADWPNKKDAEQFKTLIQFLNNKSKTEMMQYKKAYESSLWYIEKMKSLGKFTDDK